MNSGALIEFQQQSDNSFDSEIQESEQMSQIIEHDPSGRFCKYNEEIGKGAYKSVFRGYDKESGCEVAWNVFQLDNVPDNERRRAKQEISILKSLNHPNIINFVHSWQTKREIVFITEIVNGGSLKNYMRRITRPKLKVIRYWCRQILQGLEYLHSKKVIHRDLKCENILIETNNNELKIGDLGLSIYSVLGTPEFMAPEILKDKMYDTRVDIYAFGMCVLEMVTGMKPFSECRNQAQVIKRVMEAQRPCTIEAIQNEKIKHLINECLKPSEERPTATQLLNQYFNSQFFEDENSPVSINESMIHQLAGESKSIWNKQLVDSSFLSFNTKNQINTNGSTKQVQQSIESVQKKQIKHTMTFDTEDENSLDFQFQHCYKQYYVTQNDETEQDLEQRQQKELQLLLQLHKAQRTEFQIKFNKQSPNSGMNLLVELNHSDSQQAIKPIFENPGLEDDTTNIQQSPQQKNISAEESSADSIII